MKLMIENTRIITKIDRATMVNSVSAPDPKMSFVDRATGQLDPYDDKCLSCPKIGGYCPKN
jgi:hypothetical protein